MDLRVQKTYSALTTSFEELLREKEFDKITVNELCTRALVRRPTFYKHFLDKYDFLSFFFKDKLNTIFQKAVESSKNDDTLDFCLNLFELLTTELEKKGNFAINIQMDNILFSELQSVHDYGESVLSGYVQVEREQENFEAEKKYYGDILFGVTLQSTVWYWRNKDIVSKEFMTEKFKAIVQRLLATPPKTES